MSTMHGPSNGDVVTLVVPQREQVPVRVDDAATGWADLTLVGSPRTSWQQLTRLQLYVQYASAQGLCRMTGHLGRRPQDMGLRVTGYGAGETLRFTQRGNIQLLRRPDLVHARVTARIVVLRSDRGDHVAVQATCVAVSGGGLTVKGIPGAAVGNSFDFDLFLTERERPVRGAFRVERVSIDGVVDGRLTTIAAYERSRLVHYAVDHAHGRVS
ncbi:MAG: PilZ protein [Solirubrobacterales bacterium]|nr:PilZ protein [Solirubrobacterales bacterium]